MMQPTILGRRSTAFRAMGTEIVIYGPEHDAFDAAVAVAERVFEVEERRFSRFRGDSELTIVNRHTGRWTPVSSDFESLVRFALARSAATDGLFDPTVLDAVIAAGYDRDFDEVMAGARAALHPSAPCGHWRRVEVRAGAVRLPDSVGLDLGAVAKGWTVDKAVRDVLATGLPWVLVSAGGDMRIGGEAPQLQVAITDPDEASTPLANLRLDRGALATSSTRKRAWGPGLHHVIDPRTGMPSQGGAVQATVWATTAAEAEVMATWALLSGTDAVRRIPCALVTDRDEVLVSFESLEAA